MQPEIICGDLLEQPVEVIVNAWNRNIIPWWLLLPQDVSGVIKRKVGYAPFCQLGRAGALKLGSAVVPVPVNYPIRPSFMWQASIYSGAPALIQSAHQLFPPWTLLIPRTMRLLLFH